MPSSSKKAFAARLKEALLDAGHQSSRNSRTGVNVAPLAQAARTTREMARRYVLGSALPDPNKVDLIADWLKVRTAWLRDGEGHKERGRGIVIEVREPGGKPYLLTDEAFEVALAWQRLPENLKIGFRSMIYRSAAVESLLPWLRDQVPAGERYGDFERRVRADYKRLGAQLRLPIDS
jgi:hypothetical protein